MRHLPWLLAASVLSIGCGDDDDPASPAGAASTGAGAAGASGGAAGVGGAGGHGSSSGGAGGAGAIGPTGTCADTPPPGATSAPPAPAYSGGTCPALMPGLNVIQSSGADRSFLIAAPSDLAPGERLPVIFLWHWLGGEATDFLEVGDVQAAVDGQRFLAVLPEDKGDLNFRWPIATIDSDARVDEELLFFEDMLACVAAQYEINLDCVSSAGVSAGALWTGVLAGRRGERLSSMISLSGGLDNFIKPWVEPSHKMPALVLWGGPDDICVVINFENASKKLEEELAAGGHFTVECVHNCGHAAPPVDPPPGLSRYGGIWKFAFDHPYWLQPGVSSYAASFPDELPEWCGVGAGSATPRVGECPSGSGCN